MSQLIALEFHIRQILQPAGTPPFLRNLVASPVRTLNLSRKTIGITQLIGNDSNTYNGIFRYFDACDHWKSYKETFYGNILVFKKQLFEKTFFFSLNKQIMIFFKESRKKHNVIFLTKNYQSQN